MNGIIAFNTQFIKELKAIVEMIGKEFNKVLCSLGIHSKKEFKVKGVHLTYWECRSCGKRGYTKENYKFYLLDLEWLHNRKIKYPRNVVKNILTLPVDHKQKEKNSIKKSIKISNEKTYVRPPRIRKRHIKRSKKY